MTTADPVEPEVPVDPEPEPEPEPVEPDTESSASQLPTQEGSETQRGGLGAAAPDDRLVWVKKP